MARMYVLPGRRYCKVADEASAARFAYGHPRPGNIRDARYGHGRFLLDDSTVVHGASDPTAAAACELAVLRLRDSKLGRIEPVELPGDALLARAGRPRRRP